MKPIYPQNETYVQMKDDLSVPPVSVDTTKGKIEDEILAQDYEVNITKWFHESWDVYKQHWVAFCLFTILYLGVSFLRDIGVFLSVPLSYGFFIFVTNKIRYGGSSGAVRYDHFFFGYLFFLPCLLMTILQIISIFVLFCLCILPGIYGIFALSFSFLIFLEYHDQDIGVIGSMFLSCRVVNKHFLEVVMFLIINGLFLISGVLCFGVGILVTLPISAINLVFAFRDMFGLNLQKEQEKWCVIC